MRTAVLVVFVPFLRTWGSAGATAATPPLVAHGTTTLMDAGQRPLAVACRLEIQPPPGTATLDRVQA